MQSHQNTINLTTGPLALMAVIVLTCQLSCTPRDDSKSPTPYTETITFENGPGISFNMVPIPGGTFLMGSPQSDANAEDDEKPQHQVRIDPFYLCTTELTIELFKAYYNETVIQKKYNSNSSQTDAITCPTPVYGDMTMGYSPNHPAMAMTWYNATNFCKWLSLKTGKKYRLPTEAEFEYACRTGITGIFGSVDDPNFLTNFAWYQDNSDDMPHEVAKKKPNPWGLYDMQGNVCEWVSDFYSPDTYTNNAKSSPTINPQGPDSGKVHVARGGAYNSLRKEIRCADRAFEEEWWRFGDPQFPKSRWWLPQTDHVGFRIAVSID
jgi:formylglycine-generating enzyme required for sulfatase activity